MPGCWSGSLTGEGHGRPSGGGRPRDRHPVAFTALVGLLALMAWARPALFDAMVGEPQLLETHHPLLRGEPVDVNIASAADLEVLSGLGPATAAAIVASRADGGPFYEVGDLKRVRGIGSSTVAKFESLLTVGDIGPRPPPVPLDLSTATVRQLDRLPGIGPVLADRIVEYREQGGEFESVDDLMRVKGIGKATLDRLRARVAVTR